MSVRQAALIISKYTSLGSTEHITRHVPSPEDVSKAKSDLRDRVDEAFQTMKGHWDQLLEEHDEEEE